MKNVLIVCYLFPPNPGVGGRRWAKFSKYLAERSYKLHVVMNLNTLGKNSEWTTDVHSPNIESHAMDVFYPEVFKVVPTNLWQKILYRFWVLFFKIFSNGSLYDRSFFWKRVFFNEVQQLIRKHNIKNLIVTGPPFRLLYYAALLKERNNDINLILDFRDPWTDDTSFSSFYALPAWRKANEKSMEDFAIRKANYVVSANNYLTKIFQDRYPDDKNKFVNILNGFDPEEFRELMSENAQEKIEVMDFILAGTLYPDLEYIFIPFLKYLQNLKGKNENLYRKLKFNFYGQVDFKLKKMIKEYELNCISLHGFQPLTTVKEKMAKATFCMMFTAANHASNFNTKFYEYVSIKKPIVHFSNDGEISDFITQHHLGHAIRPDSFTKDFDELLALYTSGNLIYNKAFDPSQFNIKYLTDEVEKLFI